MPSFIEVEINTEILGLGAVINIKEKEMIIVLPFCGIQISPKYIKNKFFYFHKS